MDNANTACFFFSISKLTKIDLRSGTTNQIHPHSGYYFSILLSIVYSCSFFSFFTSFDQDASKVCDLVCLLICRESAKVMANKLQNWVTGNYRKATVGVNVHMSNAKIIILSALCLNCVKIVKTGKIEHCQCVVHLTFWIKRRELIMSTEAKARSRFFQSGMKLAFWSHTHFRQKEKYRKHNFDLAPCGRKTEKRNAMQNTKPLFLEMQVYTRCNSYKGENKEFFNEI